MTSHNKLRKNFMRSDAANWVGSQQTQVDDGFPGWKFGGMYRQAVNIHGWDVQLPNGSQASGSPMVPPDFYGISGGPIIVAGFDAEDHDAQTINDHISFCMTNSFIGGSLGVGDQVLMIGGEDTQMGDLNVNMTSICTTLGFDLTVVLNTDIDTVDFFDYDIIHIPSSIDRITRGITATDHVKLIARSGDIAQFVASGGGLSAFTSPEDNPAAWDWFPYGSLGMIDFGGGSQATLEVEVGFGETIYAADVIDVKPYHNTFDFPINLYGMIPAVTMSIAGAGDSKRTIRISPASVTVPARHVGNHADVQYDDATLSSSQSKLTFPENLGFEQELEGLIQDPNDFALSTFNAALTGELFIIARCINNDFALLDAVELGGIQEFSVNDTDLTNNYKLYSSTFASGSLINEASNTPAGWAARSYAVTIDQLDDLGEDMQIGQFWADITSWAGTAEVGSVVAMGHKHAPLSGLYGFDFDGNPT